ncbi:MAG TPA: right-handed parallel beta-helix repeat-containing protein, partial [Chitinispirillaceae bacterium]|nr:right-handed parallel beta-helix repeat-containing protein [Chitinispirillaceae bacterium]
RWNLEESPYIIERDLTIEKGANLTIAPGVRIIIRKPKLFDTIAQYDATDSVLVSIRVKGTLSCIGKRDQHIQFITQSDSKNTFGWYGIVFDNAPGNFVEIAFANIVNAYRAISVRQSEPVIRNNIIEYNHIGIYCSVNGNAKIYNNTIAGNFLAGIHVREANPHIANNIIYNNRNNGVMCDGKSKINFEYNCVYGNTDGDFLDCQPELGVIVKSKKKGAPETDIAHNIYKDPVFKGSQADSAAIAQDITLPTDMSDIKDTSLANIYYEDGAAPRESLIKSKAVSKRFELSSYSPCIESGLPGEEFKNVDKTRNTMGIWGGPDYFITKEKSASPAAAKKAPSKSGGHGAPKKSGGHAAPKKKGGH